MLWIIKFIIFLNTIFVFIPNHVMILRCLDRFPRSGDLSILINIVTETAGCRGLCSFGGRGEKNPTRSLHFESRKLIGNRSVIKINSFIERFTHAKRFRRLPFYTLLGISTIKWAGLAHAAEYSSLSRGEWPDATQILLLLPRRARVQRPPFFFLRDPSPSAGLRT